jgi:hypothetical protein
MIIDINSNKTLVETRSQLIKIIDLAFEDGYNEIWLKGNSQASLCILTNANSAFAMYLESNEDTCFIIINEKGNEGETEEFYLENGQLDEYPKRKLISKDKAKNILLYFYEKEDRAPDINWVEQ